MLDKPYDIYASIKPRFIVSCYREAAKRPVNLNAGVQFTETKEHPYQHCLVFNSDFRKNHR